jgi:hypothetical protein
MNGQTEDSSDSLRKPRGGITLDHLWLGIPFFIVILKGFRYPLPTLDFWWHLKMGEIIAKTHSIPGVDIFSFTAAGKPFVVQNWLAEVIYYLTLRLGGLPALIFLNSILLAIALVPVFLLCREATSRTRLAAFCALLGCFALFPNARPQVFSVCLFSIFYWILEGYRFRRRNCIWLLPLLTVLWVNLHGAFVVGIGLAALYLLSETCRRMLNPRKEDVLSTRELINLAVALLACIIATLVNPETYKIYEYIRTVLADKASQQLVMEWQPPRIDSIFISKYFFGLFYLGILGLIFTRRNKNATDIAVFLCFSIFGQMALRNTIWFAILIGPLLARYLAEIETGPIIERIKRKSSILGGGKKSSSPKYRLNLALAFIAAAMLIVYSPWVAPSLYKTHLIDPQTPVKAIDYIEQHSLSGHIFHPQVYGDYLIWRLYPKQKSYFDGRVHLFGEDFINDSLRAFYDSGWESKVARYGIQYLMLSKDPGEEGCKALIEKARASKNWEILFEDDISVLFGKKDKAGGKLL